MCRFDVLRAFAALLFATAAVLSVPGVAIAETFDVTVQSFSFSPPQLTIGVGDTVRWTNTGGTHNVQAEDGSFRCANGCDGSGGDGDPSGTAWVVSITFDSPGDVDYFCQLHRGGGMTGTVIVQGAAPPLEPGEIVVVQTPVGVNEGEGQVDVTLRRQDGSDGMVTVDYATSDDSASAGSDYQADSGFVSWTDGDTADKPVSFTILEDEVDEANEFFDVVLSNPTGGATLGSPNAGRVRIVDNDSDDGDGPSFEPFDCVPDATTLCLNEDGRFQARVRWRAAAAEDLQPGLVAPFDQRDSGIFYFFDISNAEMLVKVLNACIDLFDNQFWVYFAATTTVEYELTITDSQTGAVKVYTNDLDNVAQPVADSFAFDTCP